MVYDAPLLKTRFSKRLEKMKKVLDPLNSPYIKIHKQIVCKHQDHLNKAIDWVIAAKGEGMMIKDPESYYENKRSGYLLKCKRFDDDEATVIGIEEGTGRLKGLMGAIRVRSDSGVEFKIGSGFDDAMRAKPPKKGQRVTYQHQGVSKQGVPRFPTFIRIHPGIWNLIKFL